MSILTEEDIRAAWASTKLGLDVDEVVAFAQVLESALMRKLEAMRVNGLMEMEEKIEAEILAKLAGMELPWGDDDVDVWLEWRTGAEIADAFHQAFAQGAASVLSAEPSGFISPHDLKMLKEGYPATVVMLPGAKRTQPLYTLKEPS